MCRLVLNEHTRSFITKNILPFVTVCRKYAFVCIPPTKIGMDGKLLGWEVNIWFCVSIFACLKHWNGLCCLRNTWRVCKDPILWDVTQYSINYRDAPWRQTQFTHETLVALHNTREWSVSGGFYMSIHRLRSPNFHAGLSQL